MTKAIEGPRNARSRRTRDALLAATRDILESEGFEALTMAAVAERAGISRRAVYLHFTSRTDLVNGLFGYMAEREGLADSVRPVWEAGDPVTALRAWVRHLSRYHPRLIPVDRAIERVRPADPDAQHHRDQVNASQLAGCHRLAAWLEAEGLLAEPWTVDTATDMLWGLISTDLIDGLLTTRGWPPEKLERYLQALYEATFVRPRPERADG